MSSYACIAEFFSETDSMAYLSFLCENLEGDTNALQAFLGKSMTVLFHIYLFLSFDRLILPLLSLREHSSLYIWCGTCHTHSAREEVVGWVSTGQQDWEHQG